MRNTNPSKIGDKRQRPGMVCSSWSIRGICCIVFCCSCCSCMAWFVRFSDNWLKINERQFRHRWHRLKCVAFKVMTYVSFAPCRKEDVMCGMFYLGSNIKWPLLINYWRKDNMLANSFKILCSPFHSCALWLYLGYI